MTEENPGLCKYTFANMSSGVFNGGIAVDIGQKAETESFSIVWRVSVAINDDRRRRGMENFTDAIVQFVVCHWRPVTLLLVCHRLHVYKSSDKCNWKP